MDKEKIVRDILSLLQGMSIQEANGVLSMAQTGLAKISVVGDSKELSLEVIL